MCLFLLDGHKDGHTIGSNLPSFIFGGVILMAIANVPLSAILFRERGRPCLSFCDLCRMFLLSTRASRGSSLSEFLLCRIRTFISRHRRNRQLAIVDVDGQRRPVQERQAQYDEIAPHPRPRRILPEGRRDRLRGA